jgi:hypothetical protein
VGDGSGFGGLLAASGTREHGSTVRGLVIPSNAQDLHLAANSRSFASLRMTNHKGMHVQDSI